MKNRNAFPILMFLLFAGCGGGSSSSPPPPPPPPPPDTSTIAYDLADFDSVFINGSYVASIQRSDDYRVEITIDSSEAGKLDVSKQGNELSIDFLPGSDVRADTLIATVEMPSLNGIALRGSNNAVISGFDTNLMEITVDGNNVLTYDNGSFEYVMATIAGSSLVELVSVSSVPGAHVDVSGSSTATINLLDFATVTGALSGSASLLYYGTDVNFDMDVAPTAAITRLGDSR